MKTLFTTRAASLGAVLALCCTAACSSGSPTAPSTAPAQQFSVTDLVQGTGDPVIDGQFLTVFFTAWLFDSGAADNKGAIVDQTTGLDFFFFLGDPNFIEGWNRGIAGMRVGGRRRIVVPPELGFGSAGTENVPANSTLIFEVELLTAPPRVAPPFETTDLAQGAGDPAVPGQTLTVTYTGWLYVIGPADHKGSLFDNSDDFPFVLGDAGFIEGWNRGIEGMRVGGRRQLVVPPELAYGPEGTTVIPPNATLIFEIELLSIE